MSFSGTKFLSAVLITSHDPKRLATFYRDILCVPLEEEKHGDTELHYGCELGDLHFAIHPVENFGCEAPGVGAIKLAFEVFDIQSFVAHLKSKNIDVLYPPKKMGPMLITALRDPDGNYIEFTQLGERWIKHIENRRSEGHCLVKTWKAVNEMGC